MLNKLKTPCLMTKHLIPQYVLLTTQVILTLAEVEDDFKMIEVLGKQGCIAKTVKTTGDFSK